MSQSSPQNNRFLHIAYWFLVALFAGLGVMTITGCDTSSTSSANNRPAATEGEGYLVVVNITARDFIISLTGQNVLQTNEVIAASMPATLSTNMPPAATTNLLVESVSPPPISEEVKRKTTARIPLPANTYRAIFQVKDGVRGGETSVIIREGGRTRVDVLLDPDTETGLQLTVSN
jgi:hypothetical protein